MSTDGSPDLALCEICARSRGITAGKGRLDIGIEELMGAASAAQDGHEPGMPTACPSCGSTLSMLRREGRLGCPSCLDAFHPFVERILGSSPRGFSEALERPSRLLFPSHSREASPSAFPFFASGRGPEDDVVLSTTVRLFRNISGLPFPGGARGQVAPSRDMVASALDLMPGMRRWDMADLDHAMRRSLSERGFMPRSYAADPESLLAAGFDLPAYLLADEGDHLRICARYPGLAPEAAAGCAQGLAQELASGGFPFLSDARVGWVCSRLEDCGPGMSVSASLHLPALALTGLHDRFLRSILREGIVVRGSYAEGESSAGSVYEAVVTGAARLDTAGMLSELHGIALQAAEAERRARQELAAKARSELLDTVGRAYGLALHARRLAPGEGASHASTLRLAALLGLVAQAGENEDGAHYLGLAGRLGRLLDCMGPGTIAVLSGLADQESGPKDEELRSRALRSALKGAMLVGGGD